MDAVQKIKQTISKEKIQSLLQYQSGLYDTGDGYRCACPLHGGDNPTAFFWSYQNGLWFCFTGCHTGGDIFDYIHHLYNIPYDQFPAIVEQTAQVLGIDIAGLDITERTVDWVREVQAWIQYMNAKNHVSTNQAYDLRQLGELYGLNGYRNFTRETIDHFKACYSRTHNRIVVPLYNDSQQCIGASLRRMDGTGPKWLHLPKHMDTRFILYNLNSCINYDKIYVVEGPFDVWNMYQIGIENVVSTLGSHITREQEALILKHFTDVCLAFDMDKAGSLATKKSIDQLKYKTNLTVLDLGEYNDPGEIESNEKFLQLNEIHYSLWDKYIV